jgi:hypothetical protein
MTLRRDEENHNSVIRLSGWKLVAALLLMAIVIISTLWITRDVRSAVAVTLPLLIGVGAVTVRLRD